MISPVDFFFFEKGIVQSEWRALPFTRFPFVVKAPFSTNSPHDFIPFFFFDFLSFSIYSSPDFPFDRHPFSLFPLSLKRLESNSLP